MRQHPVRTIGLISLGAAILTASVAPGPPLRAQSPPPRAKEREKEGDDRAERLEEMKQLASAFQIVAIDDEGKETPAVMVQEPLHRWTDPTRDFNGGALWVWKTSGRPVAVIGIELYAAWSLEFVSLSTGRLKAHDGAIHWTPRKAGAEFHEIPDAPAPAASEAARLRQMRDQAKRFAAREYWINGNGQHYALRLLPQPIDRYSDPAAGVVDGGLFVYANGTNPEVLLLIEARRRGEGPPQWSYAAAPLSRAEVSLKLGTRDAWTSPSKDSLNPEDPYYVELTSRRFSAGTRTRRPKGKAAQP
jgi:hypothetical protein